MSIHQESSSYPVEPGEQPIVVREVAAPVVVREVAAPVVRVAGTETAYSSSRFAPDAFITAAAGLVLLVVGLIAVTRAGVHGPMNVPVVKVLGFTHTATLGLIETGIGVCLLICGASRSRSGALFFATVLGVGAFVGAVQAASFRTTLQLESGMAWLVFVGAAIVVVSTLMMPRILTRSTTVRPL